MYVHNVYVLYIHKRCVYTTLDLCVSVILSWLDWSYRSEDCIFAILITLNISYQECTLSV